MRLGKSAVVAIVAGLTVSVAWAQQYEQAYGQSYDQIGGYGVGTLDERVAKLEKRLSSETLMEMLNRMEQLQGDVLRMRGEIEELTHELETVKKQQKDMYLDLDQRLQGGAVPADTSSAPQAEAPTPDASAPSVATPPTVAAPTPPRPVYTTSGDTAGRQAAYQKAFNSLKDGKYPEAIKEFRSFLAAYPSGEYVDNAAYWLAEAHYVTRDFPAARDAFRKVIKEFPQSAKVSDSLLKIGFIEYETGQWANAREILGDVVKHYPETSAAQLAAKRLAKMKQEGH